MKIAFKLLLWVLVTGVILFPALLLILFVIGLSVVVSGAMAISAVGWYSVSFLWPWWVSVS